MQRKFMVLAATMMVAVACTTADASDEAAPELEHRVVLPGVDGEPARELTRAEADEMLAGLGEVQDADIEFFEMMIPHHEQALRMTRLVPTRAESESVQLLAERMDLSQADEIMMMADFLERQGVESPLGDPREDRGVEDGGHVHHAHSGELMPGMLTEEEFAQLAAAEGEEFDRLFLEFMIRHHEGALEMVVDLFEADGGQNPEVWQMANHMLGDQEIEILRMWDLLGAMETGDA